MKTRLWGQADWTEMVFSHAIDTVNGLAAALHFKADPCFLILEVLQTGRLKPREHAPRILSQVDSERVTVIVAPTGCGKSTGRGL